MKIDAPEIASHLMTDPDLYLTPIGSFLRTTSLDEMPQLWSILVGDMSFVGPRPALFNQDDLIALRKECKVDSLIPGLTGWAQINGRDNLPLSEKVKLDFEYLNRKSLWFDLKILWLTALRVIDRDNISH
jgi:O-antigen biosynthesis protein WbqP